MAREVSVDGAGKATGVIFLDKNTGKDVAVKARIVILGASACESARLLLNSKSALFPNGQGHLGRWLTDSTGSGLGGQIPALENAPIVNEDGVSNPHLYIPWWPHAEQLAGKLGFPRGYYTWPGGGRTMPDMGTMRGILGKAGNAYGKKLKEDARRYYGSFVSFGARGEMIPNEKSFCAIDPEKRDKWGIPVLRFHFQLSDYELKQVVHQQQTFAALIKGMGGKVSGSPQLDGAKAITAGGSVNHEIGTTRVSARAEVGVLNAQCQAWEVPNLFVTDGGPFVSNPYKNPTLTILALPWRACDYAMAEMKKGNIG